MNEIETNQKAYRTSALGVRIQRADQDEARQLYSKYINFVSLALSEANVGSPATRCDPPRILDVGCGNGISTLLFCERGYTVTGTDVGMADLQMNLPFVTATSERLPFVDGAFDIVAAHQALEHMPDPARCLEEMLRVTRPGGLVCIVGPNILGVVGLVRALAMYVWKQRPIRRILFRDEGMPCHPLGNTLPELLRSVPVLAWRLSAKLLRKSPTFTMRVPDTRPPFHADNDACYVCNPVDLVKWFRSRGCRIVRRSYGGRLWLAALAATGSFVAAEKPTMT